MKILVYGAGVQGSVFAALLHEAGHDVKILARGRRSSNGRRRARRASQSVEQGLPMR